MSEIVSLAIPIENLKSVMLVCEEGGGACLCVCVVLCTEVYRGVECTMCNCVPVCGSQFSILAPNVIY